MKSTTARAAKGAELLDAHLPGWHEKIDLGSLDMKCAQKDVLGQLYGDYVDGLAALGLSTSDYESSESDCIAFGFDVDCTVLTASQPSLYEDLKKVWTWLIQARSSAIDEEE